jgi:hypothetical protein
LEEIRMEHVGILYDHLTYFVATWYTYLRTLGMFCDYLGTRFSFGYVVPRKIWQPCAGVDSSFFFYF